MKNKQLLLALGAILMLASCAKTDNIPNAEMGLQLQTWASPVVSQLIVWNTGSARIGDVKILAYRSGSEQIEYRAGVDSSLNIFNATRSGTINMPSGYYQRLAFKTSLTQYAAQPALHLEGQYGAVPVIMESNTAAEIVATQDTLTVAASVYAAATRLDLSQLTNGITSAEMDAAIRTNGVIIIAAFSNPGLYSKMMLNLSTAASVVLSHQ